MLAGFVAGAATLPVLVVDDLPRSLDLWRLALGSIGETPIKLAVAILSGLLFLSGAVAPSLLRRREGRERPVEDEIKHLEGCPAKRLESSTQIRPDGMEVEIGHCLDCGERRYRYGSTPTHPPRPGFQRAPDVSPSEPVKKRVRDELVAIIDDGAALRGVLGEPKPGPYAIWSEKAATFIETVLGNRARQRFMDDYGPRRGDYLLGDALRDRLRRLGELCDRPEDWEVQIDADGLRRAIADRRFRDEADRIVEAPGVRDQAVEPAELAPEKPPIPEPLAERLADSYRAGNALRWHIKVATLQTPMETVTSDHRPQVEREKRTRAWDAAVASQLLAHVELSRKWEAAATLPPDHPTRTLIEPTTKRGELSAFMQAKMACLHEIIVSLGDAPPPQGERGTPIERLRAALRDGMDVRSRVNWAQEEYEGPVLDDPVYEWAHATWELLHAHFTEYADEFFGEHWSGLGGGSFLVEYRMEIRDLNKRGRRGYLDRRIDLLKRILNEATR